MLPNAFGPKYVFPLLALVFEGQLKRMSTDPSRPLPGAPHSRLSGAPVQHLKEAVRGDPKGALSRISVYQNACPLAAVYLGK
jgi:hypothetical protein